MSDAYEQVMTDLGAAIEAAVNTLQAEGYHVLNKWVVVIDSSLMEDEGRFFETLYPPEQATWDSKGLLAHGIDQVVEVEQEMKFGDE